MARPRKTSVILNSIEECTAAMRKLLLATLDLEKEEAARDGEIALTIKQREKRIQTLGDKRKDLELQLENYYMTHLRELEADKKKSVDLKFGRMGRRQGPASLALLNRSWKWPVVTVRLREEFGELFFLPAEPTLDENKI
ncbi:hypothetical protein LCGC14_1330430 [marine sediment metagenome]|uniref:Uncharacterized protein n=1 Tax=marine sediment metagenome TaxID=412755 RepID=A0A0F9KGU3_9ZZZZ